MQLNMDVHRFNYPPSEAIQGRGFRKPTVEGWGPNAPHCGPCRARSARRYCNESRDVRQGSEPCWRQQINLIKNISLKVNSLLSEKNRRSELNGLFANFNQIINISNYIAQSNYNFKISNIIYKIRFIIDYYSLNI